MKKLYKYGCYALLAVAVFTVWYLMTSFVLLEYDFQKWNPSSRFFQLVVPTIIVGCTIGYKEEK